MTRVTLHPYPDMPIVRVALNDLQRCGTCGAPVRDGLHEDSGEANCGWGDAA